MRLGHALHRLVGHIPISRLRLIHRLGHHLRHLLRHVDRSGDLLKKIGEEATEVVIAAKSGEKAAIIHETADLWFHTLVMLAQQGLSPDDILSELGRRFGLSGLEEKANRNK